MTVCIAAICDEGRRIVVAADRMFTSPPPVNVEFETSEKKIEQLSPSCVALSAGNTAYAYEVIRDTVAMLGGNQKPPISQVAETIKDSYVKVRAAKVRETLLLPHLGPEFLKVEQIGVLLPNYLREQQQVFGNLLGVMNGFNLGAEIIIAGISEADGRRLAAIVHPGTVIWLDKLGYASVGSGANHATIRLALGGQTKISKLSDTAYRVMEAKKAAQVAPGVGEQTDIAIVSRETTHIESWPRKFGRSGRWSFCLMTGTLCPSNQERS